MSAQALYELAAALHSADFEARVMPLGEKLPEGHLLVYLGQDDRGRDFYMQLLFLQDLQRAVEGDDSRPPEQEPELDYLQFYTALPLEVQQDAFPDLARLILRLNWGIPLGGFGLNEDERSIYLREVMLCRDGKADPGMVVETVEDMLDSLQEYVVVLEEVASGSKTIEQVLSELEPE